MLTQAQFLEPLARHRTDQIVISAMSLVRAWGRLSKHELDFAFTDSAMGHAQSLALGLALAQPQRRVICLNGDGSMLMSLGALVTIAQCRARNLILFVAQNNTYEVTGNQTTPGAGAVEFHQIAFACGFPEAFHFSDAREYERALDKILYLQGPVLVAVRLEPGAEPPPNRKQTEDTPYLRGSLADAAHRLKQALQNEG
ncbi:thiamine pyrophosphate-binding protein [Anaerolineae bacterium CFX7]|nr:thiamine pyrophosphate-binding protein [Anaerolineae bacterium CFX7]